MMQRLVQISLLRGEKEIPQQQQDLLLSLMSTDSLWASGWIVHTPVYRTH